MGRHAASFVVCAAAVLISGCVTNIKPSAETNPPPTERFGNFDRFELTNIEMAPEYVNSDSSQKALRKIQENLTAGMRPMLDDWTGKGTVKGRTLKIEPRVEQIKFVSIGDRIMVGAMAGSSAVVMKVRYRDAATGKVIAEPEFYQRAKASTHGFGAADNLMLNFIAEAVVRYTTANYNAAVGSPVGGDY